MGMKEGRDLIEKVLEVAIKGRNMTPRT